MRRWEESIPERGDCPNCGKKQGAIVSCSFWGHDIACCSDECGKEVARKLEKNMRDPEYQRALLQLRQAEERLMRLKYKGINAIGLEDSLNLGRF